MDIEKLRTQLEREEGRRYVAYLDTLGVPTIGIGHTGPDVHMGLIWTSQEVDTAFAKDVSHAIAGVEARLPWTADLDDARIGALVNMCFQLGIGGLLKFSGTLAAIKAGEWQQAHDHALASKWAQQTPARAKRVALQLLTGIWQA